MQASYGHWLRNGAQRGVRIPDLFDRIRFTGLHVNSQEVRQGAEAMGALTALRDCRSHRASNSLQYLANSAVTSLESRPDLCLSTTPLEYLVEIRVVSHHHDRTK
jgi:hypothetical protein